MDYSALTNDMLKKLSVIIRSAPQKQLVAFFIGEMYILNFLNHTGGIALPGEICSKMDISSARVAAILNSLETKGLITREADDTDKRRTLVTITDQGIQIAKEKREMLRKKTERMLIELGENDTMETLRILDRIIEITKEEHLHE